MKKTVTETAIYGISKYSSVIVTLVTTAVLSRILTPAECGVVSVITVFTAFFTVLSDMGLGTAVVQNKELTEDETNDIYSYSVRFAVILAIIFLLLGFPISAFYGRGAYRGICALLSLSVLFNAMNIVPNAVLMKGKRFSLVGKRLIISSVCSGVVAVLLALNGFSYYSIVLQSVFQAAFVYIWNIISSGLRFKLHINRASVAKVRNFSSYQFAFSIINYFARNLDNLLIGKIMGDVSLAYYDKGYKLMMYPVQNLTYVINPVLHPILSEYQHDRRRIYDSYMSLIKILSLIGVFVTAVCFLSSREIILIVFGGQWENSILLFQILSLSVWPQMVSSSAGAIYQSTGNTKLMFTSGIVHFGLTILMIAVGVFTGSLTVVAALVAASLYCRFFIDYYFLISRNFGYSYFKFLTAFKEDALVAVMLGAGVLFFRHIHMDNMLVTLIIRSFALLAVYTAALIVTGQFGAVKKIAMKVLKK